MGRSRRRRLSVSYWFMWLALLVSADISENKSFVIRARSVGGAKEIETKKTRDRSHRKHYLDKVMVKRNNVTKGYRPK